jgi:thiamine-phosphate pyrophosphorylase
MTDFSGALRGLYAITPDDRLLPRLSALVEAALRGGVRLIQYRNKQAPAPLRRAQAAEMVRICHAYEAKLIVNDDVWLAIEIGADGAHVGRDDLPGHDLATARKALGPKRMLGVSCYNDLERVAAAAEAGADYIGIGSMFPSATKPGATSASLEVLAQARRRFGGPVAAIGGITLKTAPHIIAAGADMVAAASGLFDAIDIDRRAEEFQKLFEPR